ncbi:phage tail tube protein [Glaciibacter psychrotolerans]|uniref:Phage tail protein n=1 Tax=Glaciibacter psychrotolerans TaxID=670054 RepID=A0A7Z0ED28_9MICO|nr:hypothetical protein [Leifsonia psychrotolerans]NYJ19201.1 hypothetical protein [Leifsonia psychrotolerans]
MADVIEIAPPAVDQTGMLTVFWVPTLANPLAPKVTEVKAGKRVTYSFTPAGWSPTSDQEINKDGRATLPQDLESLGKITASLSLEYVDSDDATSAAVVLVPGLVGAFVERRRVRNAADITVADKVRVYTGTLGIRSPGSPDGTGKFSLKQKVALSNVIGEEVAMVA